MTGDGSSGGWMTGVAGGGAGRTDLIAVVFLALVTVLSGITIEQYRVAGDELLENAGFTSDLDGWRIIGAGAVEVVDEVPVLHLVSEEGRGTVAIRQSLDTINNGQAVRFSGSIKTRDIGAGEKVWMAARMIFVGLDESGRSMYELPHILASVNGTNDWGHFSAVFVSGSPVAENYVELQIVNVTGEAWFRDLGLVLVKETALFSVFRYGAALAWLVVIARLVFLYRGIMLASGRNMMVVVLVLVALAGALLPFDVKNLLADMLGSFLPWLEDDASLYRIGHLVVYAMLSVAVFWRERIFRKIALGFGALVLLAVVTEAMQFMVLGRTPRITDLLVDVAGLALGLVIAGLFSQYLLRSGHDA